MWAKASIFRIGPFSAARGPYGVRRDLPLYGQEERPALRIDEVGLVLGRGLPLGRRARRLDRGEVVEPQLGHAVEVGRWEPAGMGDRVALDQPAEPGDPPADGPMHVLPVVGELLRAEPAPASDAVDELDHRLLQSVD